MRLEERMWRYQSTRPEPAFVASWRTPARTRALVAAYAVTMPLALILELAGLARPALLVPAVLVLLVSMIAWTILRSTIGMRDVAPRASLDSYEAEVLDLWRHRALALMGTMLLLGAALTVALGVALSDVVDTGVLAAVVGLYMLLCHLVLTTLPAVGYALAFNRPPEE